jgi:myo-inositol catabolism protein IolC
MGRVDAIDADYQRHERRFNITDEELVDADTGQLNTPAIRRKVKELTYLAIDRRTQEQELETARGFVRNLIRAYRRIVTALRRSLRHASKKDRTGDPRLHLDVRQAHR